MDPCGLLIRECLKVPIVRDYLKLQALKYSFSWMPKEQVVDIINSFIDGATPLMLACQEGYLDVVEYLLKECNADIEKVGEITMNHEVMEDASPLWCAAAAGHLEVVQLLVAYKASVNCLTRTHSTPLHAACCNGSSLIVEYLVAHGADMEITDHARHTCLMVATHRGHFQIVKLLLQKGADVNAKSASGNTALHEAAESNQLELVKLLVKYGARCDYNNYGMTPLLAAALKTNDDIVQFIIFSNLCSAEHAIDALELLGAAFLDEKQNTEKALKYWTLAFQYRNHSRKELLLRPPLYASPINGHIEAKEARSLEELQEFALQPDKLMLHSLVLRERILGIMHPSNAYYIHQRGALYAEAGNLKLCFKLWLYALNIHQVAFDPCNGIIRNFTLFVNIFSLALKEQLSGVTRKPYFDFEDFMYIFEKALDEMKLIRRELPDGDILFHSMMKIALRMLALFFGGLIDCSVKEVTNVKSVVEEFIKLNPRGVGGETLLHLVCLEESPLSEPTLQLTLFPNIKVAEFLLEAGASPNAVDNNRNTPLHYAAQCLSESKGLLFETLLKYGAHLDLPNSQGETALHLSSFPNKMKVCPVRYLTLQCLCSQVIQKSDVPCPEWLPQFLKTFVRFH